MKMKKPFVATTVLSALAVVNATGTAFGQQGGVRLDNSNAVLTHMENRVWTLGKTGPASASSGSGVTWNVEVGSSGTDPKMLLFNGFVTVTNTGAGAVRIGNIVVNLQRRTTVGKREYWISAAANVADATNGDAAGQARIVADSSQEDPALNLAGGAGNYTVSGSQGRFIRTAASGALNFRDASNNTVWGVESAQQIAPGGTVNLLYSAAFNNTLLGVRVGEGVRVEVIVSFSNAGARGSGGSSAQNIDINGNGVVDAGEAHVRSVPTRVSLNLPVLEACNPEATLTDTSASIATTGTASFSNFVTGIGGGTGIESFTGSTLTPLIPEVRSVVVTAAGGASGGTLTNEAQLNGQNTSILVPGPNSSFYSVTGCVDPDLRASHVVAVGAAPTGFLAGEFCTYNQSESGWGQQGNSPGTPGALLTTHFSARYPSGLTVGSPNSMSASNATRVQNFLPQSGTPGVLTANYTITNAGSQSTSAGALAGEVIALKLNVDYSAANHLNHPSGVPFGSLSFCNNPGNSVNGKTIAEILSLAGTAVGGGGFPSGHSASTLNALLGNLNQAFSSVSGGACQPSAWAQANLCKP